MYSHERQLISQSLETGIQESNTVLKENVEGRSDKVAGIEGGK
ncbi:MAG: hypothetical protein WCI92_08500 [Bacteroidota bacterium]